MQTIRIYRSRQNGGGLVAKFTGPAGLVETQAMRDQYPEPHFLWLR